ncbi:MAG TPA: fasciclin domain-containing protein [Longimicrobiales bacterium]|nr:fasciclin domain-containing protein [Longimicrobiales bacterium]
MRFDPFARRLRIAALVPVLALGLVACDDDDDPTGNDVPTLYELAQDEAELSTLVAAIDAAGLDGVIDEQGPFTVFAPVNSAFDDLPAGAVGNLVLPQNEDLLTKILTYHVVAGEVFAADLSDGQIITTLAGETLEVDIAGSSVSLIDGSGNAISVVGTDLEASNGVAHLIDMVALPELDILETAAINGFTTLVALVEDAGLTGTLQGDGPFTVFAPTDDAFAEIEAPTGELLESVLLYHVVAGEVFAADLSDGQVVTTASGESFTVNIDGSSVTITDGSGNTVNVVVTDVPASNGIIHVIDGVLLPPA